MKRILLTNDDGIEAPGLLALLHVLKSVAQVTVFAPDHDWSAAGHAKTMHKPIRISPYSFGCAHDRSLGDGIEAYTTTGTPSDCVELALMGIPSKRPELVVSGINQGANLGSDLTYSGTVAAAMEAVILGLPAIAVSLDSYESCDFSFAAEMTTHIVCKVQEHGLPSGILLNVNIPCRAREDVSGVLVTRLGRRVYHDSLLERKDPRGRPYYWINSKPPGGYLDQGTDIWAIANGYVSVTPVRLDMTAHDLIMVLGNWEFDTDRK